MPHRAEEQEERPRWVPTFAASLADIGGDAEAGFWHGVGRGLFFVSAENLPWGNRSARLLAKAVGEPPHELGRANALAGLGWVMTMAWILDPDILDATLGHEHLIEDAEGFQHGVSGAALTWCRSTGRKDLLDGFLGYRSPDPQRWRRWVRRPCEEAFLTRLPHLEQDGHWGTLFRVTR